MTSSPSGPQGSDSHQPGWQQQQWGTGPYGSPAGSGFPGQPGGMPPGEPPNSRRTAIIAGAVFVVLALASAAIGIAIGFSGNGKPAVAAPLAVQESSATPTSTSAPTTTPTRTSTSASGGSPRVQSFGLGLQSNLNYYRIDSIMSSVCADGKANGAREDLLQKAPYLGSGLPPVGTPTRIFWEPAQISKDATGDGYQVMLQGTTVDGKTVSLTFHAYDDNGIVTWCGVKASG
jgi:hypothetical protein